jgi:hypothetical protein
MMQVGKEADYDYDSTFWTSEEPYNMMYIDEDSFTNSYKTHLYYEMPITEILI